MTRQLSFVLLCLSTWLLCVCSLETDARAQDATTEAQRLFERARAAFAEGRYAEAARLFTAADAEAPHPSVVYNAAVSWELSGDLPRAADAYRDALAREGLDEQESEEARARLAELRTQLGFLQITRPLGGVASVAHHQRVQIPARFYLRPGSYQVLLESETGQATETPITLSAGESLRVELALPAAVSEAPAERAPVPLPPAMPPPLQEDSDSTQQVLGWVSVGVGVIASGVAIYMGTQALERKDDFENPRYSVRERNAARAEAIDFQRNTNLAWGGAALFGGVGAALLLTAPSIEF